MKKLILAATAMAASFLTASAANATVLSINMYGEVYGWAPHNLGFDMGAGFVSYLIDISDASISYSVLYPAYAGPNQYHSDPGFIATETIENASGTAVFQGGGSTKTYTGRINIDFRNQVDISDNDTLQITVSLLDGGYTEGTINTGAYWPVPRLFTIEQGFDFAPHPTGNGGTTWPDFNEDGVIFKEFSISRVTAGVVPEPASWAMMICGFGLVGASMRRKKASVSFV